MTPTSVVQEQWSLRAQCCG